MRGLWNMAEKDSPYSQAMRVRYDSHPGDDAVRRVIEALRNHSDPAGTQAAIEQAEEFIQEGEPETRLGRLNRLLQIIPQSATTAASLTEQARAIEAAQHVVAMLGLEIKPPHEVAGYVKELTLPRPARSKDGKTVAITSLAGVERCVNIDVIDLGGNPITSIAPLAGLPVRVLNASNTHVRDISPILAMPKLSSLVTTGARIADLRPLEQLMRTRDPNLGTFVHDTAERKTISRRFLGLPVSTWAAMFLGLGLTGCEVTLGSISGALASFEGSLGEFDVQIGGSAQPVHGTDARGRAVDFLVVSHGLRWKLGSSEVMVDAAGQEATAREALRGFFGRSGDFARRSQEVIVVGLASAEGDSLEAERVRAVMRSETIARALRPEIEGRRLWTLSLGRYWGNRSAIDQLNSADQRPVVVVFARRRQPNANVFEALDSLFGDGQRVTARGDVRLPSRADYSDFCLSSLPVVR